MDAVMYYRIRTERIGADSNPEPFALVVQHGRQVRSLKIKTTRTVFAFNVFPLS
jgi:hypothetical protein